MPKLALSVQLYTLRDLTKADFAGVVRRVAQLGYTGVELAGFGNLKSATEAKKAVADAGLKISGAHVGIEALEKDLANALDEQAELGNVNVIVPWMPDVRRRDAAGWRQVAASLNTIGAACQKRGMTLSYHNHSFEFEIFDCQSGMDILWGNSDPALVKSELDVYWVKHGGLDPVAYLNKLGKRVHLLHLKDMAADAERRFAPVGAGTIDFKGLLGAAEKLGIAWGAVEEDSAYGRDPMDDLRISMENLRKLRA